MQSFCKVLWRLDIPPRMKSSASRVCSYPLPSKYALARNIQDADAKCKLCGELQESEIRALFECPPPHCQNSYAEVFLTYKPRWVLDAILMILVENGDNLGEFIPA